MISVMIGLLFVLVGGWGVVKFFPDFLIVVKGFGPISLILGGLVAIVTGIAALSSARSNGKSKD